MKDTPRNPQINISNIPSSGGIGGAIVALSMVLIILVGIPVLWYTVPAVIALGCGVALVLRFMRHKNPGAPWILPATKK